MEPAPLPDRVIDLFKRYYEQKHPVNNNQNRVLEIPDIEAELIVRELEVLAEEGI